MFDFLIEVVVEATEYVPLSLKQGFKVQKHEHLECTQDQSRKDLLEFLSNQISNLLLHSHEY